MCLARTPGGAPRLFLSICRGKSRDQPPAASYSGLPAASYSGLPAVTSHPQAPCNPTADHTLASLMHRKVTQVPEVIRALWGQDGEDGHLHERPRPLSGYEEGKERCGDALLSCGAADGRTP